MPLRKCLLALVLWASLAANAATDHDLQFWTSTYFYGPHESTVRFYMEVQPRFGRDISLYEHLLIRPAVSYSLNERASLWFGWAWTPGFVPDLYHEQRTWQQFLYRSGPSAFPWFVRFRLEQRFIDGEGSAWRTRYMGRLSLPLDWASGVSAMIWNELFLNMDSLPNGPQAGFDRHRLFLGGIWHFHPRFAIELGYMNQIAKVPMGWFVSHNICSFLFINY